MSKSVKESICWHCDKATNSSLCVFPGVTPEGILTEDHPAKVMDGFGGRIVILRKVVFCPHFLRDGRNLFDWKSFRKSEELVNSV